MNKPISIQQSKKCMDIFEEQENCEEDCLSDEIDEISSSQFKEQMVDINSNYTSSANLFLNKTDTCQNEKCIENLNEIEKINDECIYLEKKIMLLDKSKSEEFFDIMNKLTKVSKNIDELQPLIDSYQGINLNSLPYENLVKIEINLMKLLVKVRVKISKIEYEIIKGIRTKPEDNTIICDGCKVNEINCLLHPCSHVVLCENCAKETTKCPICSKFIEYYDKIYLP